MTPFQFLAPATVIGSLGLLMAAPARAVVSCSPCGLPHGCVVRRPVTAPVTAPAAGPGVGPNIGGPVNRVGLR
jgi:hypothetical protein